MDDSRSEVSIKKLLISVAAAASLLLIPTGGGFTNEIRLTSAVGLAMALLWLTEAIPMGLTALLPLIVFPLAGVASAEQVATPYANPAVFLFLGGFLVAATVERWGLHRRIAFKALATIGTNPRRILLAILLTTAALSMWMSNTATTLMMTPIAVAIVRSLGATEGAEMDVNAPAYRLAEVSLLAVAYGASLGGIGTPIGTPTNLIFFGASKQLFPNLPQISFAQWIACGVVFLAIMLPITWLILIITGRVGKGAPIPLEQLGVTRPGALNRGEKLTIALCAATAFLWVFRADIPVGTFTVPGWSRLLPNPKAVHDATIAIVMAFIAFIIPVEKGQQLLNWSEFKRVPWDVLILFGGGFALAETLETAGFSKWAGGYLSFVGEWPQWVMIVVVCVAVTLLSEVASNVATATAMMPVAAALALSIGVHPYALMVPAVLAASSGFMLPVATAPNTIVYGTGFVRVRAMGRAGFLLDAAAAIVITLLMFAVVPRVIGIALWK